MRQQWLIRCQMNNDEKTKETIKNMPEANTDLDTMHSILSYFS